MPDSHDYLPPASQRRFRFSLATLLFIVTLIGACLGIFVSRDHRTFYLALNTLQLAAAMLGLALPAGVLLAVLLWRTDVPGRRLALAVLTAMLFIPLYLQAAAWDAGFGQQGWFSLREGDLSVPVLAGRQAVVWIHGLAAIPWVVLIVGVGLRLVEPELEEAALLDLSPWQVLWRVTLPRALPAIGAAGLWVVVTFAAEMTVSDMYRVRTYAEEIYTGFALGDNPQEAALGVLPGMLVVGGLVTAALYLAVALAPAARLATPRRSYRFELGLARWPAAGLVLLALLLIVGVPLADLCYQAGVKVSVDGETRVRAWSLAKFAQMIQHAPFEFRSELKWSFTVGGAAALLAVCVSMPLAWLARRGGVRSLPAVLATAVCLAVPGPLVGLGIVALFDVADSSVVEWLRSHTILAPTLALAIRALPITLLVNWYALASVSPELLESAAVDGAGPLTLFFRIVLPQRWGALAVSGLAAFAIGIGDLAASILAVPAGVPLLSIRVFDLIHFGVTDRLAGICLVSMATFVLLATAAGVAWRWGNREERVY